MTVLRARADLSGKRVYQFTTVQITVIYHCIFLLLFGRYSLQLDNKNT